MLAKAKMLTLFREIQLKLGFFLTHRAGASSPFHDTSKRFVGRPNLCSCVWRKFGFGSVDAFLSKIQASTKKSFPMKVSYTTLTISSTCLLSLRLLNPDLSYDFVYGLRLINIYSWSIWAMHSAYSAFIPLHGSSSTPSNPPIRGNSGNKTNHLFLMWLNKRF